MFLYRFVWTVLSGVRERDKDGPQVVNNKTFRRQLFPPSAMLDLIGGGGFFWNSFSLHELLSDLCIKITIL